jgi:hypothetical protein
MSKFNNTPYLNTNTNHPIQENSQNYLTYKKYVSIHSEDRDILSFPNSAEFEIEMPEDIINISNIKLVNWSFPSNYDTFSVINCNITMIFKFVNIYSINSSDPKYALENAIFNALNSYTDNYYITIEEGFYNPSQIAKEINNKMNDAVTKVIISYFLDNSLTTLLDTFTKAGGYTRFSVVYNNVSQKIWFGNSADSFELLNECVFKANSTNINELTIGKRNHAPDFSNWGLPGNLGLTRCNVTSMFPPELTIDETTGNINSNYLISNNYMRFYYGDVNTMNDNGFWLLPLTDISGNALPNAVVQFIECPYKINIFGPSHFYLEMVKYNCLDETQPYYISNFTLTTNETLGIVNSAFAKIPIVSSPLSQYYDGPSHPYKFFDPPIERIRRLKFRLRYHSGELVNFGLFDFSFTLEFTTLLPVINRKVTNINPFNSFNSYNNTL